MLPSDGFIEHIKSKFEKEINKESIKKNPNFEGEFYEALSSCLEHKNFDAFKELLDYSIKLDIFLDVKKISNRFSIISQHLVNSIQTLTLGEIIHILRFCNAYNLFSKVFSKKEIKLIEKTKEDTLFLANLKDLFGDPSDSFILYVRKKMPQNLYKYFTEYFNLYSFNSEDLYNIDYVLEYLDNYSMYGLSVRCLGDVKHFYNAYEKVPKEPESRYVEFNYHQQKHLASADIFQRTMSKILEENQKYKFYSLSMVLLGGAGPQGHGFTYSTPRDEVIEICSDARETEAIIVKYREFLKNQFINKLTKVLLDFSIDKIISKKIIDFLENILKKNEKISYLDKDKILKNIEGFLADDQIKKSNFKKDIQKSDKKKLLNKISNAMTLIFREIKLEDQFKTRMDLIEDDVLKSEDIAIYTTLRDKSHYDVLRERFFFQYIVEWFHDLFKSKISNLDNP
ncbi:MAG: hypothetical protein EU539_13815 [Promethearchaeota archaeon]|nr:MAG: hypothetical protein EU539_13815 [Candidatus Lokiarchaeota archaeon]